MEFAPVILNTETNEIVQEFDHIESAERALKEMQETDFDGKICEHLIATLSPA